MSRKLQSRPDDATPELKAFNDHVGECKWCRNYTHGLCPTGDKLMKIAAGVNPDQVRNKSKGVASGK